MKKLVYLVPIMVFCSAFMVQAQELDLRGYAPDGTVQEESSTVYKFRNVSTGFTVAVSLKGEPNRSQVKIVEDVAKTFASLKFINPLSARIVFAGNKAEIIVLVKSFAFKGKDYAVYMPSGIQFYYTDLLEYDFRMMVQNLFLRVKGQFFSEEQFAERIAGAVENPYAYIQSHDPEYIIKKFQEIENGLEGIKSSIAQLKKDIYAEAKAAFEEAAKKNDQSFKKTEEALAKADGITKELTKEFVLLRYGLLVLNNRGFFGSINLPSQEAIAKLVEMKKREPGLTLQEAQARMETSGIKLTSKEVFLVFSVYFNEFK